MIQDGVREIQQFFDNINPAYHLVDLSAILTLVCEHLFATLRSKTPMPDVLEVSRLFTNVLNENMKKLTDCGFRHFKHRRSHYVAPGRHISIPELELLSIPESRKLTKEEKRKMRNWRIEHCQKVRQNTIRNTSTKDKPGTLPLNMYINYKQPDPNPVNFQQLTCSKTSLGTKALYAVRHSSTESFVIVEIEQLTDDSEEKEGHMYRAGVECLTFVSSGEAKFYSRDILYVLNVNDFEKNEDTININEDVYNAILMECCDGGCQEIAAEADDETSSDEDSDNALEDFPVPTVTTRGGRIVKFNRLLSDYVA